jgi:DNA primase
MGRIPDRFIKDLLDRSDIVEVIGSRLELKRAGKEFRARSPFTNEKTPSFFVNPSKQMFFDFSSGKNGTVITFLMEYDRLTFVEAVEELARIAGLEVPREGGKTERLVLDGPIDALAAAERFWKAELRNHANAVEYLKSRGITGETAKRFGIGFAPDSWDALAKQFKDPAHAVAAGLLVKKESGGVYDRFRNRIMFPIRDTRGRVIAFGGRTLADDPAKYLNSPETPLFHKGRNLYGLYEARQAGSALAQVVVVEGYMDAVMLAQSGITEVVATLGTATTREHLNLLFKSTSKIVFCFDGDRAGRAAAWRALEQALPEMHAGRECVFMFLPEGHDPDTLVREIGEAEFRRRINDAQTLSTFLLGELKRGVDLAMPDGRAKLASRAQPHLARLREGALRASILDELVKLTRLTRADLETAVARPAADGGAETSASAQEVAAPVRRALQLLLEKPALAAAVPPPALNGAADVAGLALLTEALEFFRAQPAATAGLLLEHWRDGPWAETVNRIAAQRLELEGDAVDQEFTEQINKLTRSKVSHGFLDRVFALQELARQRPLTAEEQAEKEAITRQLAAQKMSKG